MKTHDHIKSCTWIFRAVLFYCQKLEGKQSKCPLTCEQNKNCGISIQWNIIQWFKKNPWTTSIDNSIYEPEKHYAKWKKTNTKGNILNDHTFIWNSRKGKTIRAEIRSGVARSWEYKEAQRNFLMEIVSLLVVVVACLLPRCTKPYS